MESLTVTPFVGLILSTFIVVVAPIVGVASGVFVQSRAVHKRSLTLFSAVVTILFSIFLVGKQLLEFHSFYLTPSQFSSGFVTGFISVGIIVLIGKLIFVKLKKRHLVVPVVLFLLIAYYQALQAFATAEIFYDPSSSLKLLLPLPIIVALFVINIPKGVLLTTPYFASKKRSRTIFVAFLLSAVYVVSVFLIYFFVLLPYDFEPNLYGQAFLVMFPAGGMLFVGLSEIVSVLKNHDTPLFQGARSLSVLTLVIVAIISGWFLWGAEAVEFDEGGALSGVQRDLDANESVPVWASLCEHEVNLLECLEY